MPTMPPSSGLPVPVEPVIFSKAPSSISGPDDDVIIPKGSQKLDWEVELAFVIGRRASYVSEADALDHVLGYLICNDVSERFWQIEGTGQWIKGKSAETFGPLGPWLVTSDEVGDPQDLDMWLDVNGARMQTGNTRTMIFGVAELVSYLSGKMVLEPGDVVTTGTPPGVGLGKKPPLFLKAGDVMELSHRQARDAAAARRAVRRLAAGDPFSAAKAAPPFAGACVAAQAAARGR